MSVEKAIFHSLEIIEKRINEKLTVENIAADVYISKFHYMRLFREIVGDSVMEYIIKRKLTLASKELLETNASILDIAMGYGYESRDGFSRSFKALIGKTPVEYRRQKQMKYKKTIDAITHEINEWILKANDLANQINKSYPCKTDVFWKGVAEQTETLTSVFSTILDQVKSIVHKPDEITDGMEIVKIIDDTAFVAHSIAFQIELMEARTAVNNNENSFAEKYRDLAWFGVEKAKTTGDFFRELLFLVIEDMRKTVGSKIKDAIKKGKIIADSIPDSDTYIKDEIMHIVDILSKTPIEQMTMQMLDDSFFKIKLISITAKINIDNPDAVLFEKMQNFSDALFEAARFCDRIVKPIEDPTPERQKIKVMQDIVYMENVLFFYTNGEFEYVNKILDEDECQTYTADIINIKSKINNYRKISFYAERESNSISVFFDITNKLDEIISGLLCLADKLGIRGNALRLITEEQKKLANKTRELMTE